MQVEHFLEESARRFPEKTALVCDGRRWTYRQVDERANAIAHALVDAGVGRSDRVAVYLDNSADAVLSVFAALKAGGVFLVINALILWVSTSVLGGEGKFATLLSVTTYAAITYSLLQVIGVVVLMMRGPGSVTSMLDLQPSLGLDLLAPDAKGFTLGLLRGINPFTLYGVFLTATGIAVTHKASKGVAYTAASIQFVIALLIGAALTRG